MEMENTECSTFKKKKKYIEAGENWSFALHLSGISFEEWACLSACSGWVLPPQQIKPMKKVNLWGCM